MSLFGWNFEGKRMNCWSTGGNCIFLWMHRISLNLFSLNRFYEQTHAIPKTDIRIIPNLYAAFSTNFIKPHVPDNILKFRNLKLLPLLHYAFFTEIIMTPFGKFSFTWLFVCWKFEVRCPLQSNVWEYADFCGLTENLCPISGSGQSIEYKMELPLS